MTQQYKQAFAEASNYIGASNEESFDETVEKINVLLAQVHGHIESAAAVNAVIKKTLDTIHGTPQTPPSKETS